MSRIADNIQVYQDWGEGGYRFEPRPGESSVEYATGETPKISFYAVLFRYYKGMHIAEKSIKNALAQARGHLNLVSTSAGQLSRLARCALKQEMEMILRDPDQNDGNNWQIYDDPFPGGWI